MMLAKETIRIMLLLGIILLEVYAILFMLFFYLFGWYLPDNPDEWTIWSYLEVISEFLSIALMVLVIILCTVIGVLRDLKINKFIWFLLSSVGILVACIQGYNFVLTDIPYIKKIGYTPSILLMLLFPHVIAIISCASISCASQILKICGIKGTGF